MRGTKVGDTVAVRLSATREAHGTIATIQPSSRLRLVLTATGHVWAAPDEIVPSDQPDRTKAIEDIEPGDVAVMYEGTHRRVVGGARDARKHILIFEPREDGSWPRWTYAAGERIYVASP